MNSNPNQSKRMLVLAAASLLTTATGVASSTAMAAQANQQPNQIQNAEKASGGEVKISLTQLEKAERLADGGWRVRVHPADLTGIDIPDDLVLVELHLSDSQMESALQTANKRNAVIFTIRSAASVEAMEERLLGGFSINFNSSVCDWNQQWF
jgi:hypothetical protein